MWFLESLAGQSSLRRSQTQDGGGDYGVGVCGSSFQYSICKSLHACFHLHFSIQYANPCMHVSIMFFVPNLAIQNRAMQPTQIANARWVRHFMGGWGWGGVAMCVLYYRVISISIKHLYTHIYIYLLFKYLFTVYF